MARVQFLFDYISPYAYLAWTQRHRLGAECEPVPVLFAALLNAHGHKGPAEIPSKRAYVFKNVLRLAHDFGVPLSPPPTHPFRPLLSLRVTSLVPAGEERDRVVGALFAATWGGGPGVESPEVVTGLLNDVGLDGAVLVEQASRDEAKALLKKQTERAIAAGAFGVPTFLCGEELFWGLDAMPHIERFLRGEDPVQRDAVARFQHLPASASRK